MGLPVPAGEGMALRYGVLTFKALVEIPAHPIGGD